MTVLKTMGSSTSSLFFQKSDSWQLSVIVYCTWEDRWAVLATSRKLRQIQQSDMFWRWMCSRLEVEHGVYSPVIIPVASTFRSLFMELSPLRNMWEKMVISNEMTPPQFQGGDKKKISVYARFSPKRPGQPQLTTAEVLSEENNDDDFQNRDDDVEVTLPLHQRLAMIKLSHNLKSNGQALKVLASEGGNCCIYLTA